MIKLDRIAVIIPVHNRRNITLSCLRQLQEIKTDGFVLDIVVIDDGSTDGTYETISKEYPDTNLIRGDGNLWWAGGVNAGLEYAQKKGVEFVYIINDDIEIHPGALQILYATLKENKKAVCSSIFIDRDHRNSILYAGYTYFGYFKKMKSPLKGPFLDSYKGRILNVDCLSTKSVLIPMVIVNEVGLLDAEQFPHGISDFDYFMRIKSLGHSLLVNLNSQIYTGESDSNVHYLILNKSRKEMLRLFKSEKYRIGLKATYNLFAKKGGFIWGHLRFIYIMAPHFIWYFLKFILPYPILKRILIKTERVKFGNAEHSKDITS